MTHFDVFNGDADGICALHQLRLVTPTNAVLVTGVKRDIALLRRVDARAGDAVTVLDVSADVNRIDLLSLLERRVHVQYFDHHFAGQLPVSAFLDAHIDPSPATCTSLLVDAYLNGAHRAWAIVGAFGDNLSRAARKRAETLGLDDAELTRLKELGENIALNAYGDREQDLIVHPAELYRTLEPYINPLTYIDEAPLCRRLAEQKQVDLDMARSVEPEVILPGAELYVLGDEPWARRVQGVLANELANRAPELAHAVLTINRQGNYSVSLRAPVASPTGADTVCVQFDSGGGRASAAGINQLARYDLALFAKAVNRAFPEPVRDSTISKTHD